MPFIISTPALDATEENTAHKFGAYEMKSDRPTQEDAFAWQTLTAAELTPTGGQSLIPLEIGKRLWTTIKVLNKNLDNALNPLGTTNAQQEDGSTLSTTVYDGKGNFITATLGDANSFLTIYDKQDNPLAVVRLNAITHKPSDPEETARLKKGGGVVKNGVLLGIISVSRALGDKSLQASFNDSGNDLIISDATINITNIAEILKARGIDPANVGKIQNIITCDGYTDGAGKHHQSKEDQEKYLLASLKMAVPAQTATAVVKPVALSESELAKFLAKKAKDDGSTDNVTVLVQTLKMDLTHASGIINQDPYIFGVFDGHAGNQASHFAAKNLGSIFTQQCQLTPDAYASQNESVNKMKELFERDNLELDKGSTATVAAVSGAAAASVTTTASQQPVVSSSFSYANKPQTVFWPSKDQKQSDDGKDQKNDKQDPDSTTSKPSTG